MERQRNAETDPISTLEKEILSQQSKYLFDGNVEPIASHNKFGPKRSSDHEEELSEIVEDSMASTL